MNRYDNYLSKIGNDLCRSIENPYKILDRRIGSSYPNAVSKNTKHVKNSNSVRTWDKMSHEERNKYLYG